MNDVYSRLREFMHTFPGGYPLTGVGMKILNKLFSPEDSRKIEHGETFLQDVHRYFGIWADISVHASINAFQIYL